MSERYSTPRPWLGPFVFGLVVGVLVTLSAVSIAYNQTIDRLW